MKNLIKLVFAGMIIAGTAGCIYNPPSRHYDPAEEYYDSMYGEGVGRKILYGDSNVRICPEKEGLDKNK